MDNLKQIITELETTIKQTGQFVMEIYNSNDFDVSYKSDNSPFTVADVGAEKLITQALKKLTPDIPIYGEETYDGKDVKDGKFWLIDPIDGTKAFIRGENIFTVNIALIENNKPVIGLVYDPQNNELYTGSILGAFKNGQPISVRTGMDELVVANNFASTNLQRRAEIFDGVKITEFLDLTSSIKICKIAEGVADLYPRAGYTYEWDTAAGHAILKYAGGNIVTYEKNELSYGKEKLLNPKFIFVYGDEKWISLIDRVRNN